MQSLKFLDRRAGYSLAAFSMLLAMIAPGLLPAMASADALTDRSIALSSNARSATNVSYDVTFTTTGAAGYAVIDFCSNSPVIGAACTAPTGFSTASVSTATAGTTVASRTGDTGVDVTATMAGSTTINFTLDGITNPDYVTDGSNGFYARILTFTDSTAATNYDADNTAAYTSIDEGSVALSIYDAIGVSGSVAESLTFCVASAAITANCANAATNAPSVSLGSALTSNDTSEANIYAQLSSNAKSGVVVNMKSNATGCGGLILAGTDSTEDCFIGPAPLAGIADGEAYFGVKTSASTATAGYTGASGTLVPVGSYNNTTHFMNYVAGDATGVTSTYGDPIFGSNNLPVDNQNMTLTFGASVTNTTPAGTYSADLSMIAVGKY